jgi:hypothetical protein
MSALLVGSCVAVGLTVALQGAPGATPGHLKVIGKDYAAGLSQRALPRAGNAIRLHQVWGGRQEASDRRVSGRYRTEFVSWEYADGRVHFTDQTFTLTNPRGGFKGAAFGARCIDGSHFIRAVADGTGAYKGLRYVTVIHDRASGSAGSHLFEIDGWLDRSGPTPPQATAADVVHAKITGTNTPYRLKSAMGLRSGIEKTSDPRTTGIFRGTMRFWEFDDGRWHFSGTGRLVTKAGVWTGTWLGVRTPDRTYMQFVDLAGQGALAGLRYRHVDTGRVPTSSPDTITLSVNGWIESVARSS